MVFHAVTAKHLDRVGAENSRRAPVATVSFGRENEVNLRLVKAERIERLRSEDTDLERKHGNLELVFCEGDRCG